MKIDPMGIVAVAFAGFALYTFTRPKVATQSASDLAFAMLKNQRNDVGQNYYQSTQYAVDLQKEFWYGSGSMGD